MEPLTIRMPSGKATLSEGRLTIERYAFPRSKIEEIALSQVASIEYRVTVPALFGKGGAMAITLHRLDGSALELDGATSLAVAQQFVAAVETSITTGASGTPAAGAVAAPVAEASPAAPTPAPQPAPQIVVVTAPTAAPEQMIKIYRGPDCAKQFQKEAKKLARKGWRVQSQTYGGQTNKAAAVFLLGPLGLAAGTKPREMTVVYVRN